MPPPRPEARRLVYGVLTSGTGKTWVDDLQLLVDGKPIWETPNIEPVTTVLDLDHEFDHGSGALSPVSAASRSRTPPLSEGCGAFSSIITRPSPRGSGIGIMISSSPTRTPQRDYSPFARYFPKAQSCVALFFYWSSINVEGGRLSIGCTRLSNRAADGGNRISQRDSCTIKSDSARHPKDKPACQAHMEGPHATPPATSHRTAGAWKVVIAMMRSSKPG